jgi:hypothetical protein
MDWMLSVPFAHVVVEILLQLSALIRGSGGALNKTNVATLSICGVLMENLPGKTNEST